MKKLLIIAASIALILSSCQVSEDLTLQGQSGTSSTDIHVEQFFIDVLQDFSEFLPSSNKTIMDGAVRGYAEGLGRAPSVSAAEWEILGNNSYTIDFSYTDLDALLSEMGAENQTLFGSTATSLSFYLDLDNYNELKAIVPFLADPNFEVYGPEYNVGMSEADYLEMISFLLGEEGPDAIENGYVTININVPGTITATEGCERISDQRAAFSFPIIDFLLLSEPIAFSVTWR